MKQSKNQNKTRKNKSSTMDPSSAKNGQRQFCEQCYSFMNRDTHLWIEGKKSGHCTNMMGRKRKNKKKVMVGESNILSPTIGLILFIELTYQLLINFLCDPNPVPLFSSCSNSGKKSPIMRTELHLLFVLKLHCHVSPSTAAVVSSNL